MSQSVDAMLGMLNNANQTATIIDSQRNISDNLRAATERNLNALMQGITSETQKTDNLITMNNAFANQNLSSIGSSLKTSFKPQVILNYQLLNELELQL